VTGSSMGGGMTGSVVMRGRGVSSACAVATLNTLNKIINKVKSVLCFIVFLLQDACRKDEGKGGKVPAWPE